VSDGNIGAIWQLSVSVGLLCQP